MFKDKFRSPTIFEIKNPARTDVFYIKLNKSHIKQEFYYCYN